MPRQTDGTWLGRETCCSSKSLVFIQPLGVTQLDVRMPWMMKFTPVGLLTFIAGGPRSFMATVSWLETKEKSMDKAFRLLLKPTMSEYAKPTKPGMVCDSMGGGSPMGICTCCNPALAQTSPCKEPPLARTLLHTSSARVSFAKPRPFIQKISSSLFQAGTFTFKCSSESKEVTLSGGKVNLRSCKIFLSRPMHALGSSDTTPPMALWQAKRPNYWDNYSAPKKNGGTTDTPW